jgi:YfiH family protein
MYQETKLGFELRIKNTLMFFGKKSCTLADLKQHYKDVQFRTVHQVHSDITVPSSSDTENTQADAHYTQEMNVGLVVKTADCIPLLIHASEKNMIIAIHAGWRGVENQITLKALTQLNFKETDSISVYMGPHILQNSFEVGADVKELLLKSACCGVSDVAYARGEKFYVDLQMIIKSQIQAVVKSAQIHMTDLNTYKSEQFNSHRTDQTKLRNLSFIVQKAAAV